MIKEIKFIKIKCSVLVANEKGKGKEERRRLHSPSCYLNIKCLSSCRVECQTGVSPLSLNGIWVIFLCMYVAVLKSLLVSEAFHLDKCLILR